MASSEEWVTGVVYDKRFASHYNAWNKDFTEKPQRFTNSIERCTELGLLERCNHIPVREATEAEILTYHTKKHLDLLKSTETMSEEELKAMSQKYDFIYFHQKSYENAKLSLGGVIDLVDAVASEKIRNGMAIVRPPGHHAMSEEFCGYCYFSNAAISTDLALKKFNLKRVLLFDWDVHHGQGSQFRFYNDPRVLFVSIHRYELGSEWPHLRESDYDFIGDGPGKGYTINLPLNETGCENADYLAVFFNLLLPIFYEFDPELVIVSAGYDCAIGCPEGEMNVTPACFAHFVNMLMPLASGKLALILEGGYNLKSLSESVAMSLRALLGDPTPNIGPITSPRPSVVESVLNCVKVLHPYWGCLKYQDFVEAKDIAAEQYPFHRVLHLPPVQGVQFYTKETRPELFPLLQECADQQALIQIEKFNKIVDELIQRTFLTVPEHRLCIGSDREDSHVELDLETKGLWSRCLPLKNNSAHPQTAQEYIKVAIDSITSTKTRAAMCLVHPRKAIANGTSSQATSKYSSNLDLAIQSANSNESVNRTLVIELGASPTLNESSLGENNDILYISITWPGNATEKSHQPDGNKDCIDSCCTGVASNIVKISLSQGSVTNGDLLSITCQIVLPMAYQFCPDLVIVTWTGPLQEPETRSEAFTPATLGHVIQLLLGLARGRLLLLVEGQDEGASVTSDMQDGIHKTSEMLASCVSVMLGDRCGRTASCLPSNSTVTLIKRLQDSLKEQWKMFQFRQPIPKVHI